MKLTQVMNGVCKMKNKPLGILIISFLVAFIGIAVWTFSAGGFPLDKWMLDWSDTNEGGFVHSVMTFISAFGSSEVILAFTLGIAAFFLYKRFWHHLVLFLTVSVGGVAVNLLLKLLFRRERPGEAKEIEVFDFSLNIPSYSFPSGHTMRSTILICFLMFLIYMYIRNQALQVSLYAVSIVLMFLVGLSRVFLEAHFASDVLGALTISIVWFCSVVYVYEAYMDKKESEHIRQRF